MELGLPVLGLLLVGVGKSIGCVGAAALGGVAVGLAVLGTLEMELAIQRAACHGCWKCIGCLGAAAPWGRKLDWLFWEPWKQGWLFRGSLGTSPFCTKMAKNYPFQAICLKGNHRHRFNRKDVQGGCSDSPQQQPTWFHPVTCVTGRNSFPKYVSPIHIGFKFEPTFSWNNSIYGIAQSARNVCDGAKCGFRWNRTRPSHTYCTWNHIRDLIPLEEHCKSNTCYIRNENELLFVRGFDSSLLQMVVCTFHSSIDADKSMIPLHSQFAIPSHWKQTNKLSIVAT